MSLDETSVAIGQLQAQAQATQQHISTLTLRSESMDGKIDALDAKIDRLLARSGRGIKLTFRHWGAILAGSSLGGGGVSHLLRVLLK